MRFVLDTSALLSGRTFEGELFVTPGVMRELRRHGTSPQLDAFIDTKVKTMAPHEESVDKIRAKAEETGDIKRLSKVDISVLALAAELEATLVTDDYSIENIAKLMQIPYEPVMMPPIKEEIHWKYRCKGCGRYWPEWHNKCPVCASALRTSRPKKE